jgi:hypothetical protein
MHVLRVFHYEGEDRIRFVRNSSERYTKTQVFDMNHKHCAVTALVLNKRGRLKQVLERGNLNDVSKRIHEKGYMRKDTRKKMHEKRCMKKDTSRRVVWHRPVVFNEFADYPLVLLLLRPASTHRASAEREAANILFPHTEL